MIQISCVTVMTPEWHQCSGDTMGTPGGHQGDTRSCSPGKIQVDGGSTGGGGRQFLQRDTVAVVVTYSRDGDT